MSKSLPDGQYLCTVRTASPVNSVVYGERVVMETLCSFGYLTNEQVSKLTVAYEER